MPWRPLSASDQTLASMPLVSIGLPVYNGSRYLAQSIESLLGQTYNNLELLSSATTARRMNTADICRRFAERDPRVRYQRHDENIGRATNHNLTFWLARGNTSVGPHMTTSQNPS